MDAPRRFGNPKMDENGQRLFTQFLAYNQKIAHNPAETMNEVQDWVVNGYLGCIMGDSQGKRPEPSETWAQL